MASSSERLWTAFIGQSMTFSLLFVAIPLNNITSMNIIMFLYSKYFVTVLLTGRTGEGTTRHHETWTAI